MSVRLGTDISALCGLLHMDTTKYFVTGYANHIKQYTLTKSTLDNLEFEGKFLDSVRLDFYNDKLFALELYASGNPNVEHLKFGINTTKTTHRLKGLPTKGSQPRRNTNVSRHY